MKKMFDLEIKSKLKEKPIGMREYVKLLEQHFDLTIPFHKIYLDEKLPPLEKLIQAYRNRFDVAYAKTAFVTALFFGLASSIAMAAIIIWTINEIIRYHVDFSMKNILVITSVFVLAKTKLKFFAGR